MSEWVETTLEEIAIINPAERLAKGVLAKKISMEALLPHTKKIHKFSYEKYNGGTKFRNGDTLLARLTPCLENGKTAYVDILADGEIAFGSTEFIVLREKNKKSHNQFLYYFATSPFLRDVAILSMTGSSGRQRVQTEVIAGHPFYFPPLPEQKAIASVLSSLDDKIDLLHRQNKTLEAIAETLFRQWFIEEAEEDWKETNLASHTEVFRGLSYKGSGLCEAVIGLPMHNLNSIYEGGGYKETGIKYYSGQFKERHITEPGDIIIANTEQGHQFKLIGFPAVVPNYFGNPTLFSHHLYRLIPRSHSYLTREYFYYLLMTTFMREQIISATNGSTVNMLSIDGLQKPEFKLPPKEKVLLFTENANYLRKKEEKNYLQIQSLEKLRDTLLPKLMSGEVRVKYDEVE